MAGGGVAGPEKAQKGKGGRRKKRRIHIRIDMTPMVDIVMLLLIFYMVTTVFAMPQAMEINLPPEDEKTDVEVAECKLLSLRIDAENRMFWNICNPADSLPQLIPSKNPDGQPYLVDSDSLRTIMVNLNRAEPKLNTLILIHEDAHYNSMVDILDEIDILERSWNAARATELNKDVDELTKEEKFSYRYAMGDWEDRDLRIVEAALAAAIGETGGGE
jgi:biopolymer transport protein ExbD